MTQLAEQVYNVPRPVVLKLLYVSYLILYNGWRNVEQKEEKYLKHLKSVFNTKNANGVEDGLVKRLINFKNSNYKLTEANKKLIEDLMNSADMKKINFKSIHDSLSHFENLIQEALKCETVKEEEKVEKVKEVV